MKWLLWNQLNTSHSNDLHYRNWCKIAKCLQCENCCALLCRAFIATRCLQDSWLQWNISSTRFFLCVKFCAYSITIARFDCSSNFEYHLLYMHAFFAYDFFPCVLFIVRSILRNKNGPDIWLQTFDIIFSKIHMKLQSANVQSQYSSCIDDCG